MSETQLQSLLNRIGDPSHGDTELDMTTVNGKRISKFDIKSIKTGLAARAFDTGAHLADFNAFNKTLIGPDGL